MRAALYARFSTDGQSAASIPDQLHACRRHAAGLGAVVAAEFSDAAISGRAIANRPGMLDLIRAARMGAFDLVVAEHTDRLSRSGGDSWAIFEDLRALGISINTIGQGEIGAMHVGLSGTMSALLIEETARKTRRGLEGVTRDGRSAGGLAYGYRKVLSYDGKGEPIRGLREIVPDEAKVVRRIFRAYAAGRSPRAIAEALNVDGVPGPSGGPWTASTISGNAKRGNGVLHNALYRGELVWGRNAWVKDRVSGKRRSRAGQEAGIVRQTAAELRIIDEETWLAVRARYDEVSSQAAGGRPRAAHRPKRLLSGLLRCGHCGGPMVLAGGRGSLRCQVRTQQGAAACTNTRAPSYEGVELRVLEAVKANLLHPEVVEAAVREFQLLSAKRANAAARGRADKQRELAEVERRAGRLVDQVAEGVLQGRQVAERLAALEIRRKELEAEIADAGTSAPIALHPPSPARYRQLVERLQDALADPETVEMEEARQSLRALISAVEIKPLPAHGAYALEVVADLAPILRPKPEADVAMKLGAGTRVTRRGNNERLSVRLSA